MGLEDPRDPEWSGTIRLGRDRSATAWMLGGWAALAVALPVALLLAGAAGVAGVAGLYLAAMVVGAHLHTPR